jgi:acetyl esterase/lipase
MNEPAPRHPITLKPVLYAMRGTDEVVVRRDIPFRGADGEPLFMDVYLRPDAVSSGSRSPAVVIIGGYPDPGMERVLGCRFKEMMSTVCWARLIAASGLVAIAATNRDPERDLLALWEHLREHAAALGVDGGVIGAWASSGNVALAASLLLRQHQARVRCAAFCYGCLPDVDDATGTAEASRRFGFANPCAGQPVSGLLAAVPLFLARAGRDEMPRLNETFDRFVAAALAHNLPITLVNHPEGPHAFDLVHDSAMTRTVVSQLLSFLRGHLLGVVNGPSTRQA